MSDQPNSPPPETEELVDELHAQRGGVTQMQLAHIAARVFDTPLLIHEGKLGQILQVLGPRLGFDLAMPNVSVLQLDRTMEQRRQAITGELASAGLRYKWNADGQYYNVGAAAVIPVLGTLVQRSSWLDSLSGMTSYESIESSHLQALDDPTVDVIVFDYDTPGGEAAGAFDSADRQTSLRGRKQTIAVVNELAASAGYLLASTADEIVIPRTGYAGSVGVVTAHADYSKALEKRGITVTFIYAGGKKIDGNPYKPLDERVKTEWQKQIDEMYGLFVSTVAANRKLTPEAVRATEAGVYMGRAALDVRFADQVNTLSNVVSNSAMRRGGAFRLNTSQERPTMTDAERAEQQKQIAEARAAGVAEGRTQAEAAAAPAQQKAVAEARTAERARIKAIVGSEDAKGRSGLAMHLALDTDTSAEQAAGVLKASPAVKDSKLDAAMSNFQPQIPSREGGKPSPEAAAPAAAPDLFARVNEPYTKATGGGAVVR